MICPDCGLLRHPGSDCNRTKRCPDCDGDGEVEEEFTVGGYTPDRWVEIRVQMVECEKCGGWGEVEDDEEHGIEDEEKALAC